MKITYKRMEIVNFMSYDNEVFDFEEQEGMNLITGINNDIPGSRNACGKSSLCHAIVYALFGELPFKLNKSHIYNRYLNSKNMSVTLYFDIDKTQYKIISGLKSGSSFCTFFELVKGEEKDITKSTILETRDMIERDIIKQDKNLFMRTVLLNSDPMYNFYNLDKSDRKDFIDKLFDIKDFGTIYDYIHSDSLRLKGDITARQRGLMVYETNKEDYANRKITWESSRNTKITELEKRLTVLQKDLEDRSTKIVELDKNKVDKISKFITVIEGHINDGIISCKQLESDENLTKNCIKNFENIIKDRKSIISKHASVMSKLCNGCKSIFSEHYSLDKYNKEIESVNKKIENETVKLSKLAENIKTKKNLIKEHYDKRNKALNEAETLKNNYEINKKETENMRLTVSKIISNIDELKKSVNPYDELIRSNNANIEKENTEINLMVEKYKNMLACEKIVSHDNIKKIVIKDMIGTLNAKIKHYLHRLGANYDIIFDDEMNYEFVTLNGMTAEFHNFSSGEQARISIATCFAFRDFLSLRSGLISNILMLDEFIDSNIDTMAIENIIDILNEFSKKEKQNIFVISHRNEVSTNNAFNRIIQIEKTDNVSSIKYIDNEE